MIHTHVASRSFLVGRPARTKISPHCLGRAQERVASLGTGAAASITSLAPLFTGLRSSARVAGVVILEAVIGADGRVTDVKVLRSVALLDDAAMRAVRQWEYTPTMLNGSPVPVIMTVTVNFQLR